MDPESKKKGGDGYYSRQYDMLDNFTLVINEVRVEDNDNFFCEISELGTGAVFYNRTIVEVLGM